MIKRWNIRILHLYFPSSEQGFVSASVSSNRRMSNKIALLARFILNKQVICGMLTLQTEDTVRRVRKLKSILNLFCAILQHALQK